MTYPGKVPRDARIRTKMYGFFFYFWTRQVLVGEISRKWFKKKKKTKKIVRSQRLFRVYIVRTLVFTHVRRLTSFLWIYRRLTFPPSPYGYNLLQNEWFATRFTSRAPRSRPKFTRSSRVHTYINITWLIRHDFCIVFFLFFQEHFNFIGTDDQLGPVMLSVKTENLASQEQTRLLLRLRTGTTHELVPSSCAASAPHHLARVSIDI